MNIAMFTNTYAPHVGGVARSITQFREAFRARGHRVLIVAPEFDDQPKNERGVIRVRAVRDFNHTGFSLALPLPFSAMRAIEEFAPNIIHSHHPFVLGASALRMKAALNVPIVMTYHTMYEEYTHYFPIDTDQIAEIAASLGTEYANECDHVVAPSVSIRDVLMERGVDTPMSVIPTGVAVARLQAGNRGCGRARLGISPDAFVIGHVGRLAPEKNLHYLASEAAVALRQIERSVLLVVGEGPERESIERQLSGAVPDRQLRFTGNLEGRDLLNAYHAMDVFAFASKTDTQGLVLAEAMACGVPVVGLDAPGTHDIVRDGRNGLLVTSDADGEFANALTRLDRGGPRR